MFSPYHNFENCQSLERIISHLEKYNTVPPNILEDHRTYHYALIHKLKSVEFYIKCLDLELSRASTENILSREFLFSVNRYIDGFFLSGESALDILAREVLTYFGISLPSFVYFRTARNELTRHRQNDPIISRLQDPSWKPDFSRYRNALTHELLIAGSVVLNLNIHVYAGARTEPIILPLPDDPRSDLSRRTYRRNRNVLVYCKTTFRRLVSLVNQVYGELVSRIAQNNRLPL